MSCDTSRILPVCCDAQGKHVCVQKGMEHNELLQGIQNESAALDVLPLGRRLPRLVDYTIRVADREPEQCPVDPDREHVFLTIY